MEQLGRRLLLAFNADADVRNESMTPLKDQYQIFRHLFEFGTIHHCVADQLLKPWTLCMPNDPRGFHAANWRVLNWEA